MEVITIDSKAFKELTTKIDIISEYILAKRDNEQMNEDNILVDSYEICTFLKISDRTLQRLRARGDISYSPIGGRYYYTIGEIKKQILNRRIKSTDENLNDLITNHKHYVKERRNTRENQ